jgi:hypothetical protein
MPAKSQAAARKLLKAAARDEDATLDDDAHDPIAVSDTVYASPLFQRLGIDPWNRIRDNIWR